MRHGGGRAEIDEGERENMHVRLKLLLPFPDTSANHLGRDHQHLAPCWMGFISRPVALQTIIGIARLEEREFTSFWPFSK